MFSKIKIICWNCVFNYMLLLYFTSVFLHQLHHFSAWQLIKKQQWTFFTAISVSWSINKNGFVIRFYSFYWLNSHGNDTQFAIFMLWKIIIHVNKCVKWELKKRQRTFCRFNSLNFVFIKGSFFTCPLLYLLV